MRRLGEFIDLYSSRIIEGLIIALVMVLVVMLIPIPKRRRKL